MRLAAIAPRNVFATCVCTATSANVFGRYLRARASIKAESTAPTAFVRLRHLRQHRSMLEAGGLKLLASGFRPQAVLLRTETMRKTKRASPHGMRPASVPGRPKQRKT